MQADDNFTKIHNPMLKPSRNFKEGDRTVHQAKNPVVGIAEKAPGMVKISY